jgi:predicted RNA-binding protein with TRAM domain
MVLLKKGDSSVVVFENCSDGGNGIITIKGFAAEFSPLQKYE